MKFILIILRIIFYWFVQSWIHPNAISAILCHIVFRCGKKVLVCVSSRTSISWWNTSVLFKRSFWLNWFFLMMQKTCITLPKLKPTNYLQYRMTVLPPSPGTNANLIRRRSGDFWEGRNGPIRTRIFRSPNIPLNDVVFLENGLRSLRPGYTKNLRRILSIPPLPPLSPQCFAITMSSLQPTPSLQPKHQECFGTPE